MSLIRITLNKFIITEEDNPIEKQKTKGIFFKISPEHRALLEQKMEMAGIRNMSAYIRKMCIDGYIINLDIAELKEIAKLLRVTANNVNQIARRVNSGGEAYREDVAEVNCQLEEIRSGFGKILTQLAALE